MTNQQGAPEAPRPITRYEVVDCIDSKHVPAVIPNGTGPWVRYEDHLAALVDAQQPAPSAAAANTKTAELLSTTVGLLMGYREGGARQPYKQGSVVAKAIDEVVDHLKDWPYPEPSPTPQADSQPAVDALAEAEYFIDNPSAWTHFDQRASDAIAAVCTAFRAARAPADSVLEDAARYRWLRARWGRIAEEYDGDSDQLVAIRESDSSFEGWDVDPVSLDGAIDAARKQGANHD